MTCYLFPTEDYQTRWEELAKLQNTNECFMTTRDNIILTKQDPITIFYKDEKTNELYKKVYECEIREFTLIECQSDVIKSLKDRADATNSLLAIICDENWCIRKRFNEFPQFVECVKYAFVSNEHVD